MCFLTNFGLHAIPHTNELKELTPKKVQLCGVYADISHKSFRRSNPFWVPQDCFQVKREEKQHDKRTKEGQALTGQRQKDNKTARTPEEGQQEGNRRI